MSDKKMSSNTTKPVDHNENANENAYDWQPLRDGKGPRVLGEGDNFSVVDYISLEERNLEDSLCMKCLHYNAATRECLAGYPKWAEEIPPSNIGGCVLIKKPVMRCFAFRRRDYELAAHAVVEACAKLFLGEGSLRSVRIALDSDIGTLILEGNKEDVERLYLVVRALIDAIEKDAYIPTISGGA